jgi:hypothetical protein
MRYRDVPIRIALTHSRHCERQNSDGERGNVNGIGVLYKRTRIVPLYTDKCLLALLLLLLLLLLLRITTLYYII